MDIKELRPDEYDKFYHGYILGLGSAILIPELEAGLKRLQDLFEKIEPSMLKYAYADGKWTLAQVLLHIVDTERVFQYRALRLARRDNTNLMGFDQNQWVVQSEAELRTKTSLKETYLLVRRSTLALFKTFTPETLLQNGTIDGNPISVRVLGFIICGHQKHHETIIRKRYLTVPNIP